MKLTKPRRISRWLTETLWAFIGLALVAILAGVFIITLLESAP